MESASNHVCLWKHLLTLQSALWVSMRRYSECSNSKEDRIVGSNSNSEGIEGGAKGMAC